MHFLRTRRRRETLPQTPRTRRRWFRVGFENPLASRRRTAPSLGERAEESTRAGWTGQSCAARARSDLGRRPALRARADRKSTRLNSSHTVISYAVFCLKKKKRQAQHRAARCVDLYPARVD